METIMASPKPTANPEAPALPVGSIDFSALSAALEKGDDHETAIAAALTPLPEAEIVAVPEIAVNTATNQE
jgi:hypothetical protein